MASVLEGCPDYRNDRKAALAHLEESFRRYQEAQLHLVNYLRSIFRGFRSDGTLRMVRQAARERLHHLREVDKAYELSRRAEAKFEALVFHLGI